MNQKLKKIILGGFVLLSLASGNSNATTAVAPDFSLPTSNGSTFALSDQRGKKTIVLNFWASWCEACSEEIDTLNSLKSHYANRGDIDFVGINAGDSQKALSRFVEKTGFAFTIVSDADKSVAKKFGVVGLPQTFVISENGEIVYQNSKPPKDLDTYVSTSASAK